MPKPGPLSLRTASPLVQCWITAGMVQGCSTLSEVEGRGCSAAADHDSVHTSCVDGEATHKYM